MSIVASFIIALGGYQVSSTSGAIASPTAPDGPTTQACCEGPNGSTCCGDSCETTETGCEAESEIK